MRTLIKNWWLLALCGVLDAIISVIYFDHSGHGFHTLRIMVLMGNLALAAGASTIVAAIWSFIGRKSWLLVLNGLALVALGVILNGVFGFRISLRTIALLIVVMALSLGAFELTIARILRNLDRVVDASFSAIEGIISIVFAVVFLALAFQWIKIQPGGWLPDLLWLGSFFAFSALSMFSLILRLRGRREDLPPLARQAPQAAS